MFTFIAVVASCSTKKDSVISRNYHALTTKYNVLFNGNNAFDKGIDEINNSYRDDWFLQLPIEPIEFEEDKIIAPTFNNNLGNGFNNDDDDDKKTNHYF